MQSAVITVGLFGVWAGQSIAGSLHGAAWERERVWFRQGVTSSRKSRWDDCTARPLPGIAMSAGTAPPSSTSQICTGNGAHYRSTGHSSPGSRAMFTVGVLQLAVEQLALAGLYQE